MITGRKDFVCEECGKPLREVPPPRTFWEKHGKKIIGGVAAVAVIGGGAAVFTMGGGTEAPKPKAKTEQVAPKNTAVQPVKEKSAEAQEPTAAAEPKVAAAEPIQPEKTEKVSQPVKANVQPANGKINLGYGTYKGESKNGKPHGHGTITYTSSHKIVASKDFVASPGDRFEGEFRDGVVSGGIGYWYHDGDITAVKP